jgi:hypothetical protein
MADKRKQSGYFPWIPIEQYRERPKGILISQFSYPTSFSTMYKQKLDFAVMRCSAESSVSVFTSDTYFTPTNIRAFESRGITTLAYHQIVNNPTYWTQANAELHALEFYQALLAGYSTLGYEFIPVIAFTDNTTAFNISALYNYLQWFKDEFAVFSDREIIFRADYASFSYCTYNTSDRIADLFPKLMLDKAESYDYSGLAYPQSTFTKFDRYIDWAFWVYTRSNTLGATFGLNTAAASLILSDTNYINRLNPQEYTTNQIPKVDLFVLDEDLNTQSYITGHNLQWQRRINGIDILQGEVWDDSPYVAEDNYIMFKDPFRQVFELFEIKEIEYNINSKTIYAEHISHTLLSDVVHTALPTVSYTISQFITNIISSTYSTNGIWEFGTVYGAFGTGAVSTLDTNRFLGKTVLESLDIIRNYFGAELVFRPVINSRRIDNLSKNYQAFAIDVYHNIGKNDNNFRLEVEKNVSNIVRHVDSKEVYTAVLPAPRAVADATWKAYVNTTGDFVKAVNNMYVEYTPSKTKYARNIYTLQKNKITIQDINSGTTISSTLFTSCTTFIANNLELFLPKVSYDLDLFDVEIVLGDDITIYNSDIFPKVWGDDLPTVDVDYGSNEYFYNKRLSVSGRVTEVEYDLNDMRNISIQIGDVREDFTDSYTN